MLLSSEKNQSLEKSRNQFTGVIDWTSLRVVTLVETKSGHQYLDDSFFRSKKSNEIDDSSLKKDIDKNGIFFINETLNSNNGGMENGDVVVVSKDEKPLKKSEDVEFTLSNTLEKLLKVLETAEPVDSFSKHFETNNQVVFTRQDVLDGKNKVSENREKIIELGLKIKERIDYLCEIRLNDLGLPMNSIEIAVASMVEFSQNEAKKKEENKNYNEKRVFPKYDSKIDGSPEDYLRFYFGQYIKEGVLYLHQLSAVDNKFRNNLRMYFSYHGKKIEQFVPKKKKLIDKEASLVNSGTTDLQRKHSKYVSLTQRP